MEYVFPRCAKCEKQIEKISGINRLYAYPAIPTFKNNSHIVILDSGAFGLSRFDGKITKNYMQSLSEHYEKFGNDNVLCIAPDKLFDSFQTMTNFQKWLGNGYYKNITPVLQMDNKKPNIENLKRQAEYYRPYADTVCFANANFTGKIACSVGMPKLFRFLKNEMGYRWVHVFGAGFSLNDISDWNNFVGWFDSMDSIAYYTTNNETAFGSLDPVQNIKNIVEILKG